MTDTRFSSRTPFRTSSPTSAEEATEEGAPPLLGRFLARAAFVTAALTAAGAVLGLLRDQAVAGLFGADADTDAFLVAWTVPELSATLLIEDGMALILVPAFSLALARRAEDQAGDPVRELVRRTLPRLLLGLTATAVLMLFAAPLLVRLLAPGLPDTATAVDCMRLTSLTVLTFGLAGYFSAALRAHRRFTAPAAIYVAYNVGIIAVMLAGHTTWGVRAAAAGVAAGGALMVLVQLPSALRELGPRRNGASRGSGPARVRGLVADPRAAGPTRPARAGEDAPPPGPAGAPPGHGSAGGVALPEGAGGDPAPSNAPTAACASGATACAGGATTAGDDDSAPAYPRGEAQATGAIPAGGRGTVHTAATKHAVLADGARTGPALSDAAVPRERPRAESTRAAELAPQARTAEPDSGGGADATKASDEAPASGGAGAVPALGRGALGLGMLAPAATFAVTRQAQVLVERYFASHLPEGAISHLNYAQKVAQLPMVLSLMVCTVTFPVVARAMAEGDEQRARRRVERDLALVGLVVLLGAAYVAACAPQLVHLLFERGRFDADDTAGTASVMRVYCCGLLGHSLVGALARSFFSGTRPTWYPAAVMAAGLAVTVVAGALAVGPWGVHGIAAANAAGILTTALVLLHGIGARVVAVHTRRVAAGLARLLLASAVAAAAGWSAAGLFAQPLAGASAGALAVLVVFAAVARLVRAPEVPQLFATVRRRFSSGR